MHSRLRLQISFVVLPIMFHGLRTGEILELTSYIGSKEGILYQDIRLIRVLGPCRWRFSRPKFRLHPESDKRTYPLISRARSWRSFDKYKLTHPNSVPGPFPSVLDMATTTTLELQRLESKSEHVTIESHLPASTPPRESFALPADESPDVSPSDEATTVLSTSRAVVVTAQLIGLQLFSSFCNGVTVVGLPAIIDTVKLETGLLLWPTSVFYLTAGSCLMLAGSITDVVGTRPMILAANMLLIASAFACGAARTGSELIAFRGLQGVSFAIAVPASVSIISTNIAYGRPRNLGFSCLGFSSPLGFLLGLVLGGVLVDSVGWRPAFYLAGATTTALCLFGFWALPHDPRPRPVRTIWKQLALDIDWVGTMVLSAGITVLAYVLA